MAERKIIADVTVAPGEANIVLQLTGCPYSALRYSGAALEEVRRHAVDKFLSIPRGSLEVGGLLLGRVAENVIEIHGTEEFSLEYSSGPSYRLSPGDEQALTNRLQQTSDVIGWWHSHTRSEADLSDEDLRVHRAFFSDPHAVALIIKPFKFDPAQVAVYIPAPPTIRKPRAPGSRSTHPMRGHANTTDLVRPSRRPLRLSSSRWSGVHGQLPRGAPFGVESPA